MLTRTLIAAAALALAGCATQGEYTSVRKDPLKDGRGHVVGERESMVEVNSGALVERVEVYVVLLDSEGKFIGYEQRLKDGSIVRDADGRPIGMRYLDLRSRGTNPRSSGLLLLY
jgi:hypothetical protein